MKQFVTNNFILNLVGFSLCEKKSQVVVYARKPNTSDNLDLYLKKYCIRLSRSYDHYYWDTFPVLSPYDEVYFPVWGWVNPIEMTPIFIEADMGMKNRLSVAVLRNRIVKYFRHNGIIAARGFSGNPEIWIPTQNPNNKENCCIFNKYVISPKYKEQTEGWEFHVSFVGTSKVASTPYYTYPNLPQQGFSVVAGREIINVKHLMSHHLKAPESIFPIINPRISPIVNISPNRNRVTDKYVQRKQHIDDFLMKYMQTPTFKEALGISEIDTQWFRFSNSYCYHIEPQFREVLYGGGQLGVAPYDDLKNNGPYSIPPKAVRFLFIYFQTKDNTDITACHQLEEFLRNGIGTNNSLYTYTRIPLYKENEICLTDHKNPAANLRQELAKLQLDKEIAYFAYYISPLKEGEYSGKYDYLYSQIKEALLERNIQSQAIYKHNPMSNGFNYHIPNIAIATLAKLGGIPYTLATPRRTNDLIIGVGAHLSKKKGVRFVGSAFSYDSRGMLRDFDCFPDNDPNRITSNISTAIDNFLRSYGKPERLVIHYYKTMSQREALPITQKLFNLNLSIPVYVITIYKSETEGLIGFDTKKADYMPESGTFLDMGGSFLLYNNERYLDIPKKAKMLYPIKLKIQKICNGNPNSNLNMDEVTDLITQVYQFSRLSWKTIGMQNMPITTLYPELAARIVPFFTNNTMPQAGRQTPWFL